MIRERRLLLIFPALMFLNTALSVVFGMLVPGCTPGERQVAAAAASAAVPACEAGMTFVAGAPELAGFCAALPIIEKAIASLFAERYKAAAGSPTMRARITEWHPTEADIHRRVKTLMDVSAMKDAGK